MEQELAENGYQYNCLLCDEDKLQKAEVSSAVLQLEDKVERRSIRLTEIHNENHVLRCNLDLVEEIMRKEADGDESQDTPEMERKRGLDAIFKLPTRIRGLQTQLKQFEDSKTPPDTPSEESDRKRLNLERKALWRMELERRQAREGVIREMSPIAKESVELRKKLNDAKARFRNINKKVQALRKELQNRRRRVEESKNLVRSFYEVENKLSKTQTEICKLRERIRDAYPEVKSRNDKLAEEICALRNHLKGIKDKRKNNSYAVKSLYRKSEEIKDLFGFEKWHLEQSASTCKDDLKQADDSFKDLKNIHNHVENLKCEKSQLVHEFDNIIQSALSHSQKNDRSSFLSESGQECNNMAPSSTGTETKIEKDAGDTEVSKQEIQVQEKLGDCNPPEVEKLVMECAKYRVLVETATTESDRLSYFTKMQKIRLRDLAKKVVEIKRKLSEKSEEKKSLLDQTPKAHLIILNSLERSNREITFNLRVFIREQREENEFLRAFLKNILESNYQDTNLYMTFMDDWKVLFENALQKVKEVSKVLSLKRNLE